MTLRIISIDVRSGERPLWKERERKKIERERKRVRERKRGDREIFPEREDTSVHAEDLLVDDGRNGQAVEAVSERLPQLDVIPDTIEKGRESVSETKREREMKRRS
jgi:hypothetical protein